MHTHLAHAVWGRSTRTMVLPIVLALSLLPFGAPALAAQPHAPFNGHLQAVETGTIIYPLLYVDAVGSGNATHLGRFALTYQVVVDLTTSMGDVTYQFVAANGDTLYAEGTGLGTPTPDPDVNRIEEHNTITGGTGRFAGASGSFTVVRLLNLVTGETSGVFGGYIVLSR